LRLVVKPFHEYRFFFSPAAALPDFAHNNWCSGETRSCSPLVRDLPLRSPLPHMSIQSSSGESGVKRMQNLSHSRVPFPSFSFFRAWDWREHRRLQRVNEVLLRTLPVSRPQNLVSLLLISSPSLLSASLSRLVDWRDQKKVFEHVAVSTPQSFSSPLSPPSRRIVYGNMFTVLFLHTPSSPFGNYVVNVSYELWPRPFFGESLPRHKNKTRCEPCQVTPPFFLFSNPPEVWISMSILRRARRLSAETEQRANDFSLSLFFS